MLKPNEIYIRCVKADITPYNLAKRAEISLTYAYRLYHGDMINPSTRILDQIAYALNCETKDLIV